MRNPIDEFITILGKLPKRKRQIVWQLINLPIYFSLIMWFFFGIDYVFINRSFDLLLTVFCLFVSLRLFQIGGWWWTDDEK